MKKFPLPRSWCVASAWLAVACPSAAFAAAAPGPVARAAPDLSGYAKVLYVDQARGDDIKGMGGRDKPLASIVRALEFADQPTGQARVAVVVSKGRYTQPTFALKSHVDLFGGFETP